VTSRPAYSNPVFSKLGRYPEVWRHTGCASQAGFIRQAGSKVKERNMFTTYLLAVEIKSNLQIK